MIYSIFLLIGSFYALGSQAQVCESPAIVKNAQSQLNSFVRPPNMAGSCALEKDLRVLSWKDHLGPQVSAFFADQIRKPSSGLNPSIKENLKGLFSSDYLENFGLQKNQQEWLQALDKKFSQPELQKKVIQISKKKMCANGVDFGFEAVGGFYTEVIDEKNADGASKALAKIDTTTRDLETDEQSVTVCSPVVVGRSPLQIAPTSIAYDVPNDLFFANNQSTISDEKMIELKRGLVKKLAEEVPGCKKKSIDSVDILTSSNLLANSDAIGRWDFMKLSGDRANFMKGQLAQLFEDEAENESFPRISGRHTFEQVVSVNSKGANGNGTSGPCPYKQVKVDGLINVVVDSTVSKKELEKSKYAKINFGISCLDESRKGEVVSKVAVPYYASQCYSIQIQCKP